MNEPIGKSLFEEHKRLVELSLEKNTKRIDALVSGRYTPFFATASLFFVLTGAMWATVRALEHEVDDLQIVIATNRTFAEETRRLQDRNVFQHSSVHRREREELERIREFIKAEYGITVKLDGSK